MNTIQLPNGIEYDDGLDSALEYLQPFCADDLRNFGEPTIVNLADGRQTTYFDYPIKDSSGTILFFQPVANEMKAQAMGQVKALHTFNKNVVVIPQNNIRLTKAERKLVKNGNFSPYGEIRLQAIAHYLGSRAIEGDITLAGYSFGATDAAATGAAIARHDAFEISGASFGEPTNIMNRSLLDIGKAFAGPSTEDLLNSIQMSNFPALIDLWEISPDGKKSKYLNRDLRGFVINFMKYRNLPAVKGLCHPTFAGDVATMMDAVADDGVIVVHKDLDSLLTPYEAFKDQFDQIVVAGLLKGIRVKRILTSTDQKVGHALGDNPIAQRGLVLPAIKT